MWCERRWDCRGIQASHKLWVHSCSMDTAREHLRVRDRSHADKISQACKFLGIICTQATSGKELAKMHEKEVATGSSKQNNAGLRTGQSYGRGRERTGHRLGFHLWYLLLPFSIKASMMQVQLQDSRGNRFVSLPQHSVYQWHRNNILAIPFAEEKSQTKPHLDAGTQTDVNLGMHSTWTLQYVSNTAISLYKAHLSGYFTWLLGKVLLGENLCGPANGVKSSTQKCIWHS